MTPSDHDLPNKDKSLPASISSTSSLDSMPLHLGDDSNFPFEIGSLGNDDTEQNHASSSHSRGGDDTSRPADQAPQHGVVSPSANAAAPSSGPLPTVPSMMLPSNSLGVPVLPSGTPITMPGTAGNNSIPEFLYQLTKMLTDNNRHIIEWSNGKIEVHSPHRLEQEVLHKYFRHSKFASFQRQLNYFGFRKQAGKGKMAPCSYANEAISNDLSSILLIKRKTSVSMSASAKDKEKKKEPSNAAGKPSSRKVSGDSTGVNPVLAGILQRSHSMPVSSTSAATSSAVSSTERTASTEPGDSYKAVAKSAVGRGIRHRFMSQGSFSASSVASAPQPGTSKSVDQSHKDTNEDNLSQLATNYRNSLNSFQAQENTEQDLTYDEDPNVLSEEFNYDADPTPLSQLRADSSASLFGHDPSLLELAMIPEVEEGDGNDSSNVFNFVDFPNPEVRPKSSDWDDGA